MTEHLAHQPPPAFIPPQPTPPPRPPAGRLPWIITTVSVVVAVVAVLFGLGVFGTGTSFLNRGNTFNMSGSITLSGAAFQDYLPDGTGGCQGTGGYTDMTAGTAVTVADSTGKVVATGALGAGRVVQDTACVLPINVPGVPGGLSEYVVTVSHRGSQVFSTAQATQPIELTLGG
jgi:hypothetical protein